MVRRQPSKSTNVLPSIFIPIVERLANCAHDVKFEKGKFENSEILLINGHKFYLFGKKGPSKTKNWKCRLFQRLGWIFWHLHRENLIWLWNLIFRCKAKCITYSDGEFITFVDLDHNHGINTGTKNQKPTPYLAITKEEKH